jgi:hypothetical protein
VMTRFFVCCNIRRVAILLFGNAHKPHLRPAPTYRSRAPSSPSA